LDRSFVLVPRAQAAPGRKPRQVVAARMPQVDVQRVRVAQLVQEPRAVAARNRRQRRPESRLPER
jgi:hypothetical protein